jgi:hypothetical protein
MKRVLALVLIAALATVALGIDDTVSAIQSGDQKKADKQRADVAKALAGMQRGTTAAIERKDGTKFDVVIEEITADDVTVLREIDGKAASETIPIADIAKIKTKSLRRMGTASKVLITAAIALGVLFVAALTSCSVAGGSASADPNVSSASASVGVDAR